MIEKQLEETFQSANDFQKRIIILNSITIYFLDTIVKSDDIQEFLIKPLQQQVKENMKQFITKEKIKYMIPALKCKSVSTSEKIEDGLLNGFT